ncbi:MAG: flagellar hook capping FlgD N-terminal domain-containing protein [Bacillota bacterium]
MIINSVGAQNTAARQMPVSQLESVEFLRLLTTQLRYQDPLRPLDEREFLTQMAQLSSLQELRELRGLVASTGWQAAALVGRSVGLDTPAGPVHGVVSAVQLGPRPAVVVEGRAYSLDQLAEISSEVGRGG